MTLRKNGGLNDVGFDEDAESEEHADNLFSKMASALKVQNRKKP